MRDVHCVTLPLYHLHRLVQVLHRHVGVRIDQLHAAIGLDIANEVHNVAELFLIRVTRDLTLLILEDLHEEPLVEVIGAR